MARPDAKEIRHGFIASVAFLAAGAFMMWADGPRFTIWFPIVFGGLGLVAVVVRLFRQPRTAASLGFALRDGRDYGIDVTDAEITLTQKSTGTVRRVPWGEVTAVFIIAIDAFPIGGMSFMVHSGGETMEVPSDAEGNQMFLNSMQDRLPGFDNAALVEASGMLHGFKQLWARPAG